MELRVHVSAEDCLELAGTRVGADFREWLTFTESGRWSMPQVAVQVVRGRASPVSSWPGAELGRYPTRIDVGGAALYWDAPESEDGEVSIEGLVRLNRIDAPPRFPNSVGRVQQIWTARSEPSAAGGFEDHTGLPPLGQVWHAGSELMNAGWAGAILDVELIDR